MQFSPLASLKNRVSVGIPLPFNVRDADETLMLARGKIVSNFSQLDALFDRGALVDMAELLTPMAEVGTAKREELPKLWTHCFDRVGQTLKGSPDAGRRICRRAGKGVHPRVRPHRPRSRPSGVSSAAPGRIRPPRLRFDAFHAFHACRHHQLAGRSALGLECRREQACFPSCADHEHRNPLPRDTSLKENAIACVVPETSVPVRLKVEQLMQINFGEFQRNLMFAQALSRLRH